jgi:hypothetical protein
VLVFRPSQLLKARIRQGHAAQAKAQAAAPAGT